MEQEDLFGEGPGPTRGPSVEAFRFSCGAKEGTLGSNHRLVEVPPLAWPRLESPDELGQELPGLHPPRGRDMLVSRRKSKLSPASWVLPTCLEAQVWLVGISAQNEKAWETAASFELTRGTCAAGPGGAPGEGGCLLTAAFWGPRAPRSAFGSSGPHAVNLTFLEI